MKKIRNFVPILPFVLSAGLLLSLLENYEAHMDADFGAKLSAGFFVLISLLMLSAALRKKRPRTYVFVCSVCLILCAGLFAVASTIPNCPMCDGWNEGEFHLLSHWIKVD